MTNRDGHYRPDQTLGEFFRETVESIRKDAESREEVRRASDSLFVALTIDRAERQDALADEYMADIRSMASEHKRIMDELYAEFLAERDGIRV